VVSENAPLSGEDDAWLPEVGVATLRARDSMRMVGSATECGGLPVTPPQRRVQGPAGPASQRRSAALLAVCLVLAACSGSSPAADPSTTSTSTAPPTTSTSTTTTAPNPLEEDLLAAWDAFWEAWAAVRASEDLDQAPLEAVADPDVVAGALALFERQRESGLGAVETEVVTHAKVRDAGSGEGVIEDCVLLSPSFTDSAGVWYQAELRNSGLGWIVADLRIRRGGGCVPEKMAADAIAGFEAYYHARVSFWDPPNPDHALIGEVVAEPQKSFIVDLLEEHEARGVALRGQPTTHPEVIEVRSPTELVILSCLEPDPDYGLYDLETGERLPDEPPVRQGQRDLESAVMVYEDGEWKVSDLQGQVDFACEFAPTERGLPSV
jgi:hypothetical protein